MPDATPPAYDRSTFDWDLLSTITQAGMAELWADGAFSPDKHKQPKKKLTSNVQSTSTPKDSNSGGNTSQGDPSKNSQAGSSKNSQAGSSKNSQAGSSKNLGVAYSVAGAPSVTKTHRRPTQD